MSLEPYGDLQSYLRDHRPSSSNRTGDVLSESNLLGFAHGVSKGMDHLSKHDILHRDLRTHNILVGEGMVAKISGFHSATINGVENKVMVLNRHLQTKGPTHKREIPTRWASPETLQRKEYTNKSDIWAFGILMWEIMTFGSTPYAGMKVAEMKKFLHEGFRLSCPKSCEHPVYILMLECWRETPGERPLFEILTRRLASMRLDKQQYVNVGIYEDLNLASEDISDDI